MVNLTTKAITKLMSSGNYIVEQLNLYFKNHDLTVQQYNILRILRGQNGSPINLFELQEHMIHKMSNTTRLVEKLRKKNYLERKRSIQNRRKVEIIITPKGNQLLATIDMTLGEREKGLLTKLTDKELEQLIKILTKINS